MKAAKAFREEGGDMETICILRDILNTPTMSGRLDMVYRFLALINVHEDAWKCLELLSDLAEGGKTEQQERLASWLETLRTRPMPVSRGILAAADIISQHYRRDLKLTEVAGEVYMAPTYFSTLFHKETGETFVEYVNRVRVDRACRQMMTTEEASIEEIAARVGFPSTNHFFRLFKRMTGDTPGQFRQRLTEKL